MLKVTATMAAPMAIACATMRSGAANIHENSKITAAQAEITNTAVTNHAQIVRLTPSRRKIAEITPMMMATTSTIRVARVVSR
eukprot:gene8875-8966_t